MKKSFGSSSSPSQQARLPAAAARPDFTELNYITGPCKELKKEISKYKVVNYNKLKQVLTFRKQPYVPQAKGGRRVEQGSWCKKKKMQRGGQAKAAAGYQQRQTKQFRKVLKMRYPEITRLERNGGSLVRKLESMDRDGIRLGSDLIAEVGNMNEWEFLGLKENKKNVITFNLKEFIILKNFLTKTVRPLLQRKVCPGCVHNSPSQTEHECLNPMIAESGK